MTDTAIAPIGHNNPPSEIDIFGEKVKEKYPQIFADAEKVLEAETRAPTAIDNDEISGKVGDFVKQVQKAYKALDAARESEKAEYLEAGRRVDGFFKVKYMDKLKALKVKLEALNGEYLKEKEDKVRRKKEEEAEALRLAAAEKLRIAQEQEAEAKRLQAEAEAETKRIAEESERKERDIREAAAAKERELQAQIDKLKADAADQERIRLDNEGREKIKSLEAQQKEVRAEAREDLKELKVDTKAQEGAVKEITQQAKSEMRESRATLDSAIRTDKQAVKVERLAGSSAADLARTRGEQGSLSTIETRWVGTVTDRDQLDIIALRQHIKDDDLQIALNSWVKANPGKQLAGAFIREETKAVTR